MACSVFGGSCSLCPWCGEERCPHFHDHDNDKKYWVYATDRENSAHHLLANLNTKKEVVEYVKKLVNRKWGKNYRVAERIDRRVVRGRLYKTERVYLPYVELTITNGEYSWYDSVDLLINTEDKTISYYNKWTTEFYPYIEKGEEINVEIIKPWDNKLKFTEHTELPWYPAELNGKSRYWIVA